MVMYHEVCLYNWMPNPQTGLVHIAVWSHSRFKTFSKTFFSYHVLVCPSYVVEPKLQESGVSIPKWSPKIQQGVNATLNKIQSTLVGLIISPITVSISPQFHVVDDDIFTTIHSNEEL